MHPHKESTSDESASNSIRRDTFHTEQQTVHSTSINPDLVQQLSPQDLFEKQIEDIDRELGKFELPNGADHDKNLPGITSTHLSPITTPISMHTNPSQIPKPTQPTPIMLDENLKHNNSPEDTAPLSTWKRIPRVDKSVSNNQSALVGLKRTGSGSDVELFATITWNLWNRRNNLRLGKPTIPLDKVLEHSREQPLESHFSTSIMNTRRQQSASAWIAPDQHWAKVNFDGTITPGKTPIARIVETLTPAVTIASSLFFVINSTKPSLVSFAKFANAAFSAFPIPFVASAFTNWSCPYSNFSYIGIHGIFNN
nr:hypothetical protein CFP56_51332 [Quercus suber]